GGRRRQRRDGRDREGCGAVDRKGGLMSEPMANELGGDAFATIPEAIDEIASGRVVIVVDDADRENEGDLIVAAEKVTPETIAFMVRYTSGVICMPMMGERLDELHI